MSVQGPADGVAALVAFARKDGTRDVMRPDSKGTVVGHLPWNDRQRPDTNLAELRCVGPYGTVIVAANDVQITAFDGDTGQDRLGVPDQRHGEQRRGHIVVRQGATISLLRDGPLGDFVPTGGGAGQPR